MAETKSFEVIEKESVTDFNFPDNEVLDSGMDVEHRDLNLHKALILGNSFRRKVKVIFKTLKGIKQVETTIWAVTEKNITLKGGIHIPINCILKISFY